MDMTLEKFLKDFGRLGDLNCCLAEGTATGSGDNRSCFLNQISLGHMWFYHNMTLLHPGLWDLCGSWKVSPGVDV